MMQPSEKALNALEELVGSDTLNDEINTWAGGKDFGAR
jgi:hypothetical protein